MNRKNRSPASFHHLPWLAQCLSNEQTCDIFAFVDVNTQELSQMVIQNVKCCNTVHKNRRLGPAFLKNVLFRYQGNIIELECPVHAQVLYYPCLWQTYGEKRVRFQTRQFACYFPGLVHHIYHHPLRQTCRSMTRCKVLALQWHTFMNLKQGCEYHSTRPGGFGKWFDLSNVASHLLILVWRDILFCLKMGLC